MTCGHCVAAVTSEVTKLEGVTGVEVDLATGNVAIASDGPLSDAEVRAAIKDLTGVDISVDEVQARIRAMNGSGGLVPMIDMLAKTGDSRKFMVTVKAQIAWKRRNAFAKVLLA